MASMLSKTRLAPASLRASYAGTAARPLGKVSTIDSTPRFGRSASSSISDETEAVGSTVPARVTIRRGFSVEPASSPSSPLSVAQTRRFASPPGGEGRGSKGGARASGLLSSRLMATQHRRPSGDLLEDGYTISTGSSIDSNRRAGSARDPSRQPRRRQRHHQNRRLVCAKFWGRLQP